MFILIKFWEGHQKLLLSLLNLAKSVCLLRIWARLNLFLSFWANRSRFLFLNVIYNNLLGVVILFHIRDFLMMKGFLRLIVNMLGRVKMTAIAREPDFHSLIIFRCLVIFEKRWECSFYCIVGIIPLDRGMRPVHDPIDTLHWRRIPFYQ